MGWRTSFDAYRGYEPPRGDPAPTRSKVAGRSTVFREPQRFNTRCHRRRTLCPTAFTMSTALLGDGFYVFDLHGMMGPPLLV